MTKLTKDNVIKELEEIFDSFPNHYNDKQILYLYTREECNYLSKLLKNVGTRTKG